jgi:hypothetical protein
MTLYQTIHKALREKGMGALPEILEINYNGDFGPVHSGADATDYALVDRIMPLFAAAHLGFSPYSLGVMMNALEVGLEDVDRGIELGRSDPIARQQSKYATPDPDIVDGSRFDGIVFLQQIVLAYNLVSPDPGEALESTRAWLERPSTRMIAAMSLGLEGVSCKQLMDSQAAQISTGLDISLIDSAALDIGEVCLNTSHPIHLPNGSMTDFFAFNGAFSEHILRKRITGIFFWEQLIALSQQDEMKNLMLDHVLSVHLERNPLEVKRMLLSYEDGLASAVGGISGIQALEHLYSQLVSTPLKALLDEPAFVVEFLVEEMQHEAFTLLDGNDWGHTMSVDLDEVADIFEKFFKSPETLYQRIMQSQMRDSIPNPANHFLLWGKMKDVSIPSQEIDADIATRYVEHMVGQLQTLRYEGYEQTPELEMCYDDINQSMRALIGKIEKLVDYKVLKALPQVQRDDLIMWNFDPAEMGLTEGRIATKRLEIDLGL